MSTPRPALFYDSSIHPDLCNPQQGDVWGNLHYGGTDLLIVTETSYEVTYFRNGQEHRCKRMDFGNVVRSIAKIGGMGRIVE